ncbi:hypothetical protein [Victivallis sp. Marseille-Q1083]|uniref:hypothetical protein n=1 Tax=Victivallis sp. Marseille-Q1083 TaxID=2717288 RepID=UPI001589D1CE|nr:hypothetical protein [Victivallis sp. Marseille-Q1083]
MDSRCDAFIAMRLDEPATLQVAADWWEHYLSPEIAAENIRCNGCMAEAGLRCAQCAACPQWPCRLPEELYRFPGEAAQDYRDLFGGGRPHWGGTAFGAWSVIRGLEASGGWNPENW